MGLQDGRKKSAQEFSEKIARGAKRVLILAGTLWLGSLLMFPILSYAAESSSVATAELQLEPVIVVEAIESTISESHTGSRAIEITADFSVEANTKQVDMFVETTAFYLNGVISDPEVAPIPLDESAGVEVDTSGANLISGTNPANYIGDGEPVAGYPSRRTTTLSFESSEMTFDHSTSVTVTWNQDDPEKPQGDYSGYVKLFALINP